MSDTASKPNKALPLFRPWVVVVSFVTGLILMSILGRTASDRRWHDHFTRFFPMIAPDTLYQPTVGEMVGIVRKACPPDKILVIVGGNSILYGVGQPPDKMWTRHLQNHLGPEYVVVNLAFRGSSPTDGGAVIAEVLRNEYSRILYIANIAPLQYISPIGLDTYRFLTLDAYYKGKLLDWEPRDEAVKTYPHTHMTREQIAEAKLAARLDSVLYFRDFWTRFKYRHFSFFSWPTDSRVFGGYRPRKFWTDTEPDFNDIPREHRYSPETVAADTFITERWTEAFYYARPNGVWEPNLDALKFFEEGLANAFPLEVRPRTLIVVGRNSPFYTQKLTPEVRERDNLAVRATVDSLEKAGYAGLAYGADYLEGDFGDRTHLTVSGGQKLAEIVAPKLREMSRKLGYSTNNSP